MQCKPKLSLPQPRTSLMEFHRVHKPIVNASFILDTWIFRMAAKASSVKFKRANDVGDLADFLLVILSRRDWPSPSECSPVLPMYSTPKSANAADLDINAVRKIVGWCIVQAGFIPFWIKHSTTTPCNANRVVSTHREKQRRKRLIWMTKNTYLSLNVKNTVALWS